jgi:hypothetical protein
MLSCSPVKREIWEKFSMKISWPRVDVVVERQRLEIASLAPERPSDAPKIAGVWMRYATCGSDEASILDLANGLGLLRQPGETLAEWREFTAQLALLAKPWTAYVPPETTEHDPDRETEMPPPGPGSASLLMIAHAHARTLRQAALWGGDVGLDVGDVAFEIAPRTLAGALAIQASLALLERPRFRKCAHCSGWFAVGRADQKYCMPKHRFAAQREKEKP